ncbi:MAG: hypothetical protein ABIJ31_00135 [Pseudomonadota bacterium]
MPRLLACSREVAQLLEHYLAQMAIDQAQEGDFSMIHELHDLVRHPFDEQKDRNHFAEKRPD